ncbi:MAG TPA: trigger factor [Polyangiaceae bacterium]|jgi:trigger factor|nr:trigger factor [Polyangiaceae bacterium]
MQVTIQKLSAVLVEFDVEVDAARVSSELSKAYATLAKSARVKGFRPGKAPKKVLAHYFGPRVSADVAQRLVDDTFQKAVAEQNVQPVTQPAIEPSEIVDNKPFTYKARVEILPEIASVNYDGFEVKRPKVAVTDELVNAEIETLRRENSTLEPLKEERLSKSGDVVLVDYTVEAGGIPVPDAGANDLQTELGHGDLLPAIDTGLSGKKVGDTAIVEVDLGPTHPHPGLRGQRATFKFLVKEVKERVLPNVDDEFAKDLGDYETLDALKKEITGQVEKRLKEESDNAVAEELVKTLVEKNPIDVPPSLVQRQMQVAEQEVVQLARRQGRPGAVPPELRARIQADSEMKVRAGLLMAEIAKKENIKIGDPEIEEGLKELAEQSGKNLAKLRAEYREAQKRETLIGMILENKVLDIIESKSKITES